MNALFNHPQQGRPMAAPRFGFARLFMAAMLSLPAMGYAADITLEQALSSAERYSAELSANQHQVNALENMASSATQLPDPKLKFGIENLPVGGSNARRFTREGMTMQRVGIMQDYISSDKRQRKADTLSAEARKTAAGSETIRTRLQKEVAQAWLDLALTEQAVSDAKVLVQESEKQVALQRAGVASGGALPSSVLDARLTFSAMQDRLTNAQRDVALAQTQLTQLTGIEVNHISGPMPSLPACLPREPYCMKPSINIQRLCSPAVKPMSPKRAPRNPQLPPRPMLALKCITPNGQTNMRIWPV